MLGLLFWYEETKDRRALTGARRMGDLICSTYGPGRRPALAETGNTDKNLAPAHSLCLLYRRTGDPRHLDTARRIVEEEFSRRAADGTHLAGDHLEDPLRGGLFFECPRPRWESLHAIMALAELYDLTGEERYREAFIRIWKSIAATDRHNHGGFTSGERATGDPYHQGAIETCCTIAWLALSVEMLRLTGGCTAADELELATFNSVTALHSPSGRWATYDTPMDGVRRASAHSIVFQAREGTPELNCCSVNSVRGFGMVSDWALLRAGDAVVVNWWGPGRTALPLSRTVTLTLTQTTDYPYGGKVVLEVQPSRKKAFPLWLRIPRWSRRTRVKLNGSRLQNIPRGDYLRLTRTWTKGDVLELRFDMRPYTWTGKRSCAGKVSLYRGPLLLAWDRRYNDHDPDDIPVLDVDALRLRRERWRGWLPPRLLLACTASDGRPLHLCDFDSAGRGGSPYISWLPATHRAADAFEPHAPSEAQHLRAELGMFRTRWLHYLDMRNAKWIKPADTRALLAELRRDWPRLDAVRAAAEAHIAACPESEGAILLREGLSYLEHHGLFAPGLLNRRR